jgi:hypothetical protein
MGCLVKLESGCTGPMATFDGGVDLPIKGLAALSDGGEIGEILDGMA